MYNDQSLGIFNLDDFCSSLAHRHRLEACPYYTMLYDYTNVLIGLLLYFLFLIITLLHIKYEQRNTITIMHFNKVINTQRVQVMPSL